MAGTLGVLADHWIRLSEQRVREVVVSLSPQMEIHLLPPLYASHFHSPRHAQWRQKWENQSPY